MVTGYDFVSTGKPTYWPTNTRNLPDLIHFFIIDQISNDFITVENSWDLNLEETELLTYLKKIDIKEKIATPDMLKLQFINYSRIDLEKYYSY